MNPATIWVRVCYEPMAQSIARRCRGEGRKAEVRRVTEPSGAIAWEVWTEWNPKRESVGRGASPATDIAGKRATPSAL